MHNETADAASPDLIARDGTCYAITGNGKPVVLVHGVGMSQPVWASQVATIAATRQVITYDLLGHGRSPLPPVDATLSDYSTQLLMLFDELDIAQADIIGHSMGALIALEFGITQPQRCSSVVALNAVFCRTPEQWATVMGRAADLEKNGISSTIEPTLARWFGDESNASLTWARQLVKGLLQDIDPVGYARSYSVFASSDARHASSLKMLKMPALFLTGECDPNSTPEMSEVMASLAPYGRSQVLSSERHMMGITAAVRVNQAIVSFLDQVDQATVGSASQQVQQK